MSEKVMCCPDCGKPVQAEFYNSKGFCPHCSYSKGMKWRSITGFILKVLTIGPKSFRFDLKCEIITEKIDNLFDKRGFKCTKKGYVDKYTIHPFYHRKYESPFEGLKAIEVKVERLRSSVRIKFELVYKEGGILGRGKESQKFEFSMNPEEYLDDGMIVKDKEALQKVLNGYLKTIGIPSD